jgi:hypothetical protein
MAAIRIEISEDQRRLVFHCLGKEELMFQQEGYDFMAAAFEVYNEIGYGMAEEIYQQSLEIELALRQIPFLTKQELEVYYKGRKLATGPTCSSSAASPWNSRPSRNC